MNKLHLTAHARQRKQQRGISDLALKLLMEFGDARLQKGGTYVHMITEKTRRELLTALDMVKNVSWIEGEGGDVVTLQHTTRKIRSTRYAA